MKYIHFVLLGALLVIRSAASVDLGHIFLVFMASEDAPLDPDNIRLVDQYCFDSMVPRNQSPCRIRVLVLQYGVFSHFPISNVSLDFKHPSRPGTGCHVRWPTERNVTAWCEETHSGAGGGAVLLPSFREENTTIGRIVAHSPPPSDELREYKVYNIRYYRDGLVGFSEQRPTVVFRAHISASNMFLTYGRPPNSWEMGNPCVYDLRGRCRPSRVHRCPNLLNSIIRFL